MKVDVRDYYSDLDIGASGQELVGSVRLLRDKRGFDTMLRKQPNGVWAVADSWRDKFGQYGDLNLPEERKERVSEKVNTNLIPRADVYLENGFNVLLIALHGVGKTESIMQLAKLKGLKMKYYSCATLDPFTDLVGVPTPRIKCALHGEFETRAEHKMLHADCQESLIEHLKMVRPRDVDEAELIFFDEFNRADSKTMNAVFEIVQFGSINGEKLPNLRACWAAINPPDEDQQYDVEKIDAALLDRFDVYIEMTPRPSVTYMSNFMPQEIAAALYKWWDKHHQAITAGNKEMATSYISPRRLMKIGLIWMATKDGRSVEASLPRGGDFERAMLKDMLKQAQARIDKANGIVVVDDPDDELAGTNLGDRPADFVYTPANIKLQATEIADFLEKHPMHHPTHDEIKRVLSQGTGGDHLVIGFGRVLNALTPSHLEAMIDEFPSAKVNLMQVGFMRLPEVDQKKYKRLYKALTAVGNTPSGWPKL